MLARDVVQGLRSFARSPGFTLAALLTLAVGIGGTTAVFSAAEAIFLRPLPYPESDRLVFLSSSFPGNTNGSDNFSIPDFLDLQRASVSYDKTAAFYDWVGVALTGEGEPMRLTTNFVSADYFEIFGARAESGRLFTPEENPLPRAEPLAVISHACWQRVFGGDPSIVGRAVSLNETPVTIVGVMSRDFRDLEETWRPQIDLWLPLAASDQLLRQEAMTGRERRLFWGVGRLRDGVTASAALEEATAISDGLAAAYPDTNAGYALHVLPLRDHFVGGLYSPVALLVAGAGVLLLICCVNVANLLLVRVGARRRELAVRAALGASRGRITRHLLVECAMLSAGGGLLGLLLSLWAVDLLATWDAIDLPPFLTIEANATVLLTSIAVTTATALLFGALPGLEGSRVDLRESLNHGARQTAGRRASYSRRALTVVEISLAVVLLAGAGLTARSFQLLVDTDLGFSTESLVTGRVDLRAERYAENDAMARFGRRIVEAARAIPGVRDAVVWGPGDLGGATWVMSVAPEGREIRGEEDIAMAHTHRTNPGALADLGIGLLRGRDMSWDDTAETPRVAVVSQSLADAFWPGEEAVGKRFWWQGRNEHVEVVGVAADAKHRVRFHPDAGALAFRPQLDVYMPVSQSPVRAVVLAVRTETGTAAAEPAMREALRHVDPDLALYDVRPVAERLRAQEGPSRAIATLMTAYAAAALLLAALGVYGVLSESVGQRTRELGIRMALGASRARILSLVLAQGVALVAAGIAVGLGAALAITRLLSSVLFGVSAADPAIYASIVATLAVVALVACYIPARRATRVDPMTALRSD
jgi:putative ABC transport system permease protein